jgi:hypothetical protein
VVIGIAWEKTEIMKHDEKNKMRIDPTPFMSAIMKIYETASLPLLLPFTGFAWFYRSHGQRWVDSNVC